MASAETPVSTQNGRYRQIFPVLTAAQIETARRFAGPARRYEPGALVYGLGERNAPTILVLSGVLQVRRLDAAARLAGEQRRERDRPQADAAIGKKMSPRRFQKAGFMRL